MTKGTPPKPNIEKRPKTSVRVPTVSRTDKLHVHDSVWSVSFKRQAAHAQQLAEHFCEEQPGVFRVDRLLFTSSGLLIQGRGFEEQIVPDGLQEFITEGRLSSFSLGGHDAAQRFREFQAWGELKETDSAIAKLSAGVHTVQELLGVRPRLRHDERFLLAVGRLVCDGRLPKARAGRKLGSQRRSESVSELIAWAEMLRGKDGLTLHAAIERALAEHPELVPPESEWTDPVSALLRAYERFHQAFERNRKAFARR